MVVDAQMPVRAKRIQYFDDRLFRSWENVGEGCLDLNLEVQGRMLTKTG